MPAETPCKLSDGGGDMYVEIVTNGSKFWRMKVRQVNGKESRLTFSSYPEMTLTGARAERSRVEQQQATGLDPVQTKRIEKLRTSVPAVNAFARTTQLDEFSGAFQSRWHEERANAASYQNIVSQLVGTPLGLAAPVRSS
jgi:hypothetical protein